MITQIVYVVVPITGFGVASNLLARHFHVGRYMTSIFENKKQKILVVVGFSFVDWLLFLLVLSGGIFIYALAFVVYLGQALLILGKLREKPRV